MESSVTYSPWTTDTGSYCNVAVIALEDIGAVILGASKFFVRYNENANQYTNKEGNFLSIHAKSTSINICCCNDSDDPMYCESGGLNISFLGGEEAVMQFATALKIIMVNRGLSFPQARAVYVTFKL